MEHDLFDFSWRTMPPSDPLYRAVYEVANQAIEERLTPPPYFVGDGSQIDDSKKLVSKQLLFMHLNRQHTRIEALEKELAVLRRPWWQRLRDRMFGGDGLGWK